jgi:hypothetical protein
MSFWDSVSGFTEGLSGTVSNLADAYSTLGQAGIIDVGPSGGGSSGGQGGYAGTNYGAGYSFPPPSFVAPPMAPPAQAAAGTPAFVWIAGAVAIMFLAKR